MSFHRPLSPELPGLWRLRSPVTGREVVLAAVAEVRYVDRETGAAMEVTGQLLPLDPSSSRLPWSEENLRFCPSCDQLVQKDLNFCPYDGRPLTLLDRPVDAAASSVDGQAASR